MDSVIPAVPGRQSSNPPPVEAPPTRAGALPSGTSYCVTITVTHSELFFDRERCAGDYVLP